MTTYININGDVRDASSLTVPSDRTFRGAWQFNGDVVEVDMTKAREIHKDNLRAERAPRLEALDVDYMKALEAGSGADAILNCSMIPPLLAMILPPSLTSGIWFIILFLFMNSS